MTQYSNRFNDRFLRHRFETNKVGSTFNMVDASRTEKQYITLYRGIVFVINRDHAYRDHATGPITNPRFGGPAEIIETIIIQDAFRRWKEGKLKNNYKIAAGGPGVIFREIPVRYNALMTDEGRIVISDYMVWQGTVSEKATWQGSVSQDWIKYT